MARMLLVFESRALRPVGGFALMLVALGIGADVIGRNLFQSPVQAMHPLIVNALAPLIAFFPLALLVRTDGHVRVSFVLERFSPKVQAGVTRASSLLQAIFWGLIAFGAVGRAVDRWVAGDTSPPLIWSIHPAVPYTIAAVGTAVAAALYVVVALRSSKAMPLK